MLAILNDALSSQGCDVLRTFLQERDLISPEFLDRVQRVADDTGESWHRVLVRPGLLGEPELAAALSEALRLPLARLGAFPVRPVPDLPLRPRFLVEHRVLPLAADAMRRKPV
jgi:hypothetical protein